MPPNRKRGEGGHCLAEREDINFRATVGAEERSTTKSSILHTDASFLNSGSPNCLFTDPQVETWLIFLALKGRNSCRHRCSALKHRAAACVSARILHHPVIGERGGGREKRRVREKREKGRGVERDRSKRGRERRGREKKERGREREERKRE